MFPRRFVFYVLRRNDEWLALSPSTLDDCFEYDSLRAQGFLFFDENIYSPYKTRTLGIRANSALEAVEEAKRIYAETLNNLHVEINKMKRGDLVFNSETARQMLGLNSGFNKEDLKRKRNELVRKYNSDQGGDDSIMKFILESFKILESDLKDKF